MGLDEMHAFANVWQEQRVRARRRRAAWRAVRWIAVGVFAVAGVSAAMGIVL